MNVQNLIRIYAHLGTVNPEMFSMTEWRDDKGLPFDEQGNPNECNTVACVLGHCAPLDAETIRERFIYESNEVIDGQHVSKKIIRYDDWGRYFLGLIEKNFRGDRKNKYGINRNLIFDFITSTFWDGIDNSLEGARKRILYVLDLYNNNKLELIDNSLFQACMDMALQMHALDDDEQEFIGKLCYNYSQIKIKD